MTDQLYNSEFEFADYVVSHLDILGYREILDGCIEHMPYGSKDKDAWNPAVDSMHKVVVPITAVLDSIKLDQFPDLRMYLFGDSIVLYAQLRSPTSVQSVVQTSAAIALQSLSNGIFIRGSIATGWAVEIAPGQLHGRAPYTAYCLESEVADWPRVIVSKCLYEHLRQIVRTASLPDAPTERIEVYKRTLEAMTYSMDGVPFIDYLRNAWLVCGADGAEHARLTASAYEVVKQKRKRMETEKRWVEYRRLGALLRYFTDSLGSSSSG